MSGTVPRLQRPTTTTMAPPYSTALQYPHQMTAPLSSLPAPPISLATPIPIQQQQSLFAQQLITNMAPPPMPTVSTTTTSQPQTANNSAIHTPVNSSGGGGGGGVDDAEFLAFLENLFIFSPSVSFVCLFVELFVNLCCASSSLEYTAIVSVAVPPAELLVRERIAARRDRAAVTTLRVFDLCE
ncbi:unnamed protein product [Nippostrongylus brasiliensis]|uniref:Uncharacterized protein n=1 Tax=Nippostrongylus brasiliensis TaxID=27835 RepID=A0A0N4Y610_NIPBR|nr:unnamed protein product [Nippostrongylus brasiliensis]